MLTSLSPPDSVSSTQRRCVRARMKTFSAAYSARFRWQVGSMRFTTSASVAHARPHVCLPLRTFFFCIRAVGSSSAARCEIQIDESQCGECELSSTSYSRRDVLCVFVERLRSRSKSHYAHCAYTGIVTAIAHTHERIIAKRDRRSRAMKLRGMFRAHAPRMRRRRRRCTEKPLQQCARVCCGYFGTTNARADVLFYWTVSRSRSGSGVLRFLAGIIKCC